MTTYHLVGSTSSSGLMAACGTAGGRRLVYSRDEVTCKRCLALEGSEVFERRAAAGGVIEPWPLWCSWCDRPVRVAVGSDPFILCNDCYAATATLDREATR